MVVFGEGQQDDQGRTPSTSPRVFIDIVTIGTCLTPDRPEHMLDIVKHQSTSS